MPPGPPSFTQPAATTRTAQAPAPAGMAGNVTRLSEAELDETG